MRPSSSSDTAEVSRVISGPSREYTLNSMRRRSYVQKHDALDADLGDDADLAAQRPDVLPQGGDQVVAAALDSRQLRLRDGGLARDVSLGLADVLAELLEAHGAPAPRRRPDLLDRDAADLLARDLGGAFARGAGALHSSRRPRDGRRNVTRDDYLVQQYRTGHAGLGRVAAVGGGAVLRSRDLPASRTTRREDHAAQESTRDVTAGRRGGGVRRILAPVR